MAAFTHTLLFPEKMLNLQYPVLATRSERPLLASPVNCPRLHTNSRRRQHVWCSPTCGLGGGPDVVKSLGGLLWGKGLPPGALVGLAKDLWTTGWLTMMAQLAPSGGAEEQEAGAYKRPSSQFRNRPQELVDRGRYHLYVALGCPWAHRAAIVHKLKGLEEAVPLSVAVPGPTGLWEFRPLSSTGPLEPSSLDHTTLVPTEDRANGLPRLVDVYRSRKGGYDGRSTVPMLWDSRQQEVVNNESADIIEIFNSDFNHIARNPEVDLAPPRLREGIARWNEEIYANINNGVYRCGFSQGQSAYETAVESLFAALDKVEQHLCTSRYLCGDDLTLADVRLFTTLYRFDSVYHILFKCSKQKLSEYPNLFGYMRDVYQVPGVASTCDMEAIMDGYYKVLFPLNPGGIRPSIPRNCTPPNLWTSHSRESLAQTAPLAASA